MFAPSQAALVTQSGSGTTNMCDTNTYCMVNDNVMRNTESNASVDCLHADLCTTLLPRSLNASPCTLPKLAATATGTGTRMMSPFPRVARGTATTLCSTPTRVRLPQATSPSAGCRLIPVSTPSPCTEPYNHHGGLGGGTGTQIPFRPDTTDSKHVSSQILQLSGWAWRTAGTHAHPMPVAAGAEHS